MRSLLTWVSKRPDHSRQNITGINKNIEHIVKPASLEAGFFIKNPDHPTLYVVIGCDWFRSTVKTRPIPRFKTLSPHAQKCYLCGIAGHCA
jgi:hypothetical protein